MYQRLTMPVLRACSSRPLPPDLRRRGGTTVEYALFLTLIGAAIFAGGLLVNMAVKRSFARTSAAVAGQAQSTGTQPAHVALTPRDETLEYHVAKWQLCFVALGLATGAVVWRRLYCHREARRQPAREVTAPASHSESESQALLFEKRQEVLRILASDWHMLLDSRLQVRHLMTHRLTTISPTAPAAEARRLMQQQGVRHLMVRDRVGALVGVISDRDLGREGRTAEEIMTPGPVTVAPDGAIAPAITAMLTKHISCLPVVDGHTLVGVLTTTDLAMALQCTLQTLSRIANQLQSSDGTVAREEPALA